MSLHFSMFDILSQKQQRNQLEESWFHKLESLLQNRSSEERLPPQPTPPVPYPAWMSIQEFSTSASLSLSTRMKRVKKFNPEEYEEVDEDDEDDDENYEYVWVD